MALRTVVIAFLIATSGVLVYALLDIAWTAVRYRRVRRDKADVDVCAHRLLPHGRPRRLVGLDDPPEHTRAALPEVRSADAGLGDRGATSSLADDLDSHLIG